MYFSLENTEYRLGFRYWTEPANKEKEVTLHIPLPNKGMRAIQIHIVDTWTRHWAEAVLYKKVDGAPANPKPEDTRTFHWEPIARFPAECSRLDNYNRVRGRTIAFNRLEQLLLKSDVALAEKTKWAFAHRKALAPSAQPSAQKGKEA